MTSPSPGRRRPPPDAESMEAFDQMDRITQRVLRCVLLAIPVWLVLLVLIPQTGLGALPSMTLATLCTVAVVVVAERRRGRMEGGGRAAGGGRTRRQMGPLAAAGLTLGGVVLVIYVIFVIRVAVGGG